MAEEAPPRKPVGDPAAAQGGRPRAWLAHLGLVLAGILIILFPFTLGAEPNLDCRGVPMNPGDTCTKADGEALETYEDRVEKADSAKPIVVVVGLVVAGFGGVLLYGSRRQSPPTQR